MALPDSPAPRHRVVAAGFTEHLLAAQADAAWDRPAPVRGWTARDVVGHLTGWLPALLASGAGIELPRGPGVQLDPVTTWTVMTQAVQDLLDDPATSQRALADPHIGELPVPVAVDRFYTSDVLMHTWDLGRAVGRRVRLDPGACADLLAGMEPVEELMRGSGQYGPRVEVPEGSDPQTRLLGFIGRDPCWTPAG